MNRIDQKFSQLKKTKRKAFVAFITAGDPNLKATEQLVIALAKSGADIVELGVPFSDPLADGTTIQASSQRALAKGVTLNKILATVQRVRRVSSVPLALMMYYNQVFSYGEAAFINKLKQCGVDGLIIPDLPPEEAGNLIKLARRAHIATVFFISPTTTNNRIKLIEKASTGFIYYVALTGVTGARRELSADLIKHLKQVKRKCRKPVCVGFGISNVRQVLKVAKAADGVIVGSAIVERINRNARKAKMVANVASFVKNLSQPLR